MDKNLPYMVSFSGGRTSAMMTHLLLDQLKDEEVIVCFANTGKEEEATLEFVHNCDKLWGGKVVWLEYNWKGGEEGFIIVDFESAARNGEPFAALIKKRGFTPNVVSRFCTQELKVRVIKKYMQFLGYKEWINTVGIRYDEPTRWRGKSGKVPHRVWENWFPLVDMRVTKPQVLAFWKSMPFDLQLREYQGNCDACFLKGKKKLIQIIREAPEKLDWWIEQEKLVGGTFNKRHSLSDLRTKVLSSPSLFSVFEGMDVDPTEIQCFCNTD